MARAAATLKGRAEPWNSASSTARVSWEYNLHTHLHTHQVAATAGAHFDITAAASSSQPAVVGSCCAHAGAVILESGPLLCASVSDNTC